MRAKRRLHRLHDQVAATKEAWGEAESAHHADPSDERAERVAGVGLTDFRVGDQEADGAGRALTDAQKNAVTGAITNVARFHAAEQSLPLRVETAAGVVCERILRPIPAVGLYVPAGTAPLPSTAIMLAVPAGLAGCPVKVLCTPPRAAGRAEPAVVYAAQK